MAGDDDGSVSVREPDVADQGAVLLALYDRALPQVYGYLLPRCGGPSVAEDLTAETFLAAVTRGAAAHRARPDRRLADRRGPPQAGRPLAAPGPRGAQAPPGRAGARRARRPLEPSRRPDRAHEVLADLGPHHRAALTLRYLDGLSVPEVAEHLGRTVHATEALLVRARIAFRRAYDEVTDDGR